MTNIYENFPLKNLSASSREDTEMLPSKIKTIQNTIFSGDLKPKKRKSTPDAMPKTTSTSQINSFKSRSAKSSFEIVANNKPNECSSSINGQNRNDGESEEPARLVSEERNCLKEEDQGEVKTNNSEDGKVQKHSTSTFDDGYESYNSTPLQGSGKEVFHFAYSRK